MANRVTGLSGMDIEGMVSSMMKAETAKVDKLYKQKQLIQWKQEAYLNMTSALSTFQKKFLDLTSSLSFKLSAVFSKKSFSVKSNGADSSAITVKNSTLGKNAEYKIAVKQLAQAEKMVGKGNTTGTDGYTKKVSSGEVNINDLRANASITLDIDGTKKTVKLSQQDIDDINNTAGDKMGKLAEILNDGFQSQFKAGTNTTFKLQIEADGNKLSFQTEAGRTLSVSSFSNGYSGSMSFAYDKANTNDTLSFDINGTSIQVDTYRIEGKQDVDGNYYEVDEDGNFVLDDGNKVAAAGKVYLSASELAASINEKINESGINGTYDPETKKAEKSNLVVTASGNNIKFTGSSEAPAYTIEETTNAEVIGSSFAYDKEATSDTLTFNINGGDSQGGTTLRVDTFEWVDEYEDDGAGGQMLVSKKVYLDADELAKKINNAINDAGINGSVDPDTGIAAESNLVVSVNGGRLEFTDKSETGTFTVTQEDELGVEDTGAPVTKKTLTGSTGEFEIYGKTTSALGVTAGMSTDKTSTLTVAEALGVDDADLASMTINGSSFASLGIKADMTIDKMVSTFNSKATGVSLNYNAVAGTYTMQSTAAGTENAFDLNADAMDAFGFSKTSNYTEAKDAIFFIDGVETSRSSNDVSIGDLNITLNKVSETDASGNLEEITVKAADDTESTMTAIKDFIEAYNSLLNTLTTAYSETKAKTGSYSYYEPLTDEEKSAMTEKDIELWEEKAKVGILSRDSAVGKMVDSLRSVMTSEVSLGRKDENGREMKISLSSIGISSTDWKDYGKLTIDEEKLKKALEERPEDVMTLFTKDSGVNYYGDRSKRFAGSGIAYRLDDAINDGITTKPNPNSKQTVYGYFIELVGSQNIKTQDNKMVLDLKEINNKIWDLEQLNLLKENNYYNQFSKMEQAMTKAQNQMQMAGLSA